MANSDDDRDGRNAVARGYVIATRVTSIGLQMVIPPVVGMWADGKLKTAPWLLILGAAIGFTVSMIELVALANAGGDRKTDDSKKPPRLGLVRTVISAHGLSFIEG